MSSSSSTARYSDSFDTQRDVLMNIIHQYFDNTEEGGIHITDFPLTKNMHPASGRNTASRKGERHHNKATTNGAPRRNKPNEYTTERTRRHRASEDQNTRHYVRPTGPEQVSPRLPSCTNLPPTWNYVHDRFIAYLATHAPLDSSGRIPRHEEMKERWRPEEIARLLEERFPSLGGEGVVVKVSMVEKRLALLDAGDNDYFQMDYMSYMYEEWGHGI